MAEHPSIPAHVTTCAIAASPGLARVYLAGGGTRTDLRTDLSHALAAALGLLQPAVYTGPERRHRNVPTQQRRRVIDLTSSMQETA